MNVQWKYTGDATNYTGTWLTMLRNYSANQARQSATAFHSRWHDLNGDGRSDYIVHRPNESNYKRFWVKLSSPSGYNTLDWFTANNPGQISWNSTHWVDLNADGKTDLVNEPSSGYTWTITPLISNDTGFIEWGSFTSPKRNSHEKSMYMDMTGDRLPDRVTIAWSGNTSTNIRYYTCLLYTSDAADELTPRARGRGSATDVELIETTYACDSLRILPSR